MLDETQPRIHTVLLVDWPSTRVPRALLEAGLTVYSYCPDRYSRAEIMGDPPLAADGVYPPADGESGHLVFRALEEPPAHVDIVCAYRPPTEERAIILQHVVPLGAICFWAQPAPGADATPQIEEEYGLTIIRGDDIATAAAELASWR